MKDIDFENLLKKVMEVKRIPEIKGSFHIYQKKVSVTIDGVFYDLSKEIPDHIWRLGVGDNIHMINHPKINWQIRSALSKEVNRIIATMLNRTDIRIML